MRLSRLLSVAAPVFMVVTVAGYTTAGVVGVLPVVYGFPMALERRVSALIVSLRLLL